jgi:hypothetical protein
MLKGVAGTGGTGAVSAVSAVVGRCAASILLRLPLICGLLGYR